MKVFLLGTSQLNFIYLLARNIRKVNSNVEFASWKLNPLGGKPPVDLNLVIAHAYQIGFYPFHFLVATIRSLFRRIFWVTLGYILFVEFKFGKALHFIFHWNKEYSFFLKNPLKDYSVFHFHFIQYSYVRPVWFVPSKKKIICTFWGSDLLRTNDSFNRFFVHRALERADIITTQSHELKERILSKYGDSFKDKIRVMKLILDSIIFDSIDKGMHQREAIRACLGIDPTHLVIVVGHNANPFNNHMAAIDAIGLLGMPQRVRVIVPFGYAATDSQSDYEMTLINLAKTYSLTLHFEREYLPPNRVAELWLIADIMIHIPTTDALSAAATECMYAGNVLLTGSWLPYSPFKEAGLHFVTSESPNEISIALSKIVANLEIERARCAGNRQAIRNYFFPEVTVLPWIELYKELDSK